MVYTAGGCGLIELLASAIHPFSFSRPGYDTAPFGIETGNTVAGSETVSTPVAVRPLREARMLVEPESTAVASPDELIVATDSVAEVHCAVALTLVLVPSLYFAVAVNC